MGKAINTNKIEFANALRGVAAMSVLISHYCGVFWLNRDIAGTLANVAIPTDATVPTPAFIYWLSQAPFLWGPFGVALFFLISGFVIPFTFQRTTSTGFLVGRIFRIYPLYFAGFSVSIFSLWISGIFSQNEFPFSANEVFIHFIPGLRDILWSASIDGIIWTLEIEIKFYIVCALSASLLRRGSILTFLVPVALLAIVYKYHTTPWGTLERTFSHSAEYMIFMFIGVAFNFYFRQLFRMSTLIIATIGILFLFWAGMHLTGEQQSLIFSYGFAFIVFATSAALSPWWPRVSVVSFFSNISFPLYVTHGVMGYALIGHLIGRGATPIIAIVLATGLAIAVAWLLHVTLEIHMHLIGQYFTKRFFFETAVASRPIKNPQ